MLVQACLRAWKDRESSFHLCGGPVKLVLSCICAGSDGESSFNLCGSSVKHVWHVYVRGTIVKAVFTSVEDL